MQGIRNLKVNLNRMIRHSDRLIIFPHVDLDFDAIASSLGVSLLSEKLKKESHILIGDRIDKLEDGLQEIIEDVRKDHSIIRLDQYDTIKTPDTLNVICDTNKPVRTYVKEFEKDKLAIIDHHDKDNETFDARLLYINSKTSSASEIVARLLFANRVKIPENIANMLIAGILLDTDGLSKNDSDETMRCIKELKKYGATQKKARDYFTVDFESERKVHQLVSEADIYNKKYAIMLGNEDQEYTKEELAKAADWLLRYKVDASFAIGIIENGIISISARSKNSLNAGSLMREFAGGGNHYSGAAKVSDSSVQEVGDKLKKLILTNNFCDKKNTN